MLSAILVRVYIYIPAYLQYLNSSMKQNVNKFK